MTPLPHLDPTKKAPSSPTAPFTPKDEKTSVSTDSPLVSVIVPTKNSEPFLEACLSSVRSQIFTGKIELIVVDNFSTDKTRDIALQYADQVFQKGPERCTQRNFGVPKSHGTFVFIIDSDMKLAPNVLASCVSVLESHPESVGVIVPEESYGEGFWAKCKKLEKSFYVGIPWMEAARFFRRDIFEKVGGYDESMVSGEDWDLSQRIEQHGKIGRINDFIYHNEGRINLWKTVKKKFYYAQKFAKYTEKNRGKTDNVDHQTGILSRYRLFFAQPKKLFKNPLVGVGMLFMKTCEFGFGGVGYITSKWR